MKKLSIVFFMVMMTFSSFELLAQQFDYHSEESPAISWNGVQMFDARMMAMGGISLMASEPFAAAVNPALISAHRQPMFGFSFNNLRQEAFQYWGVNQGVIVNEKPYADNHSAFNGITGTLRIKGIRFAAGWFLSNLLQFPSFKYEVE